MGVEGGRGVWGWGGKPCLRARARACVCVQDGIDEEIITSFFSHPRPADDHEKDERVWHMVVVVDAACPPGTHSNKKTLALDCHQSQGYTFAHQTGVIMYRIHERCCYGVKVERECRLGF